MANGNDEVTLTVDDVEGMSMNGEPSEPSVQSEPAFEDVEIKGERGKGETKVSVKYFYRMGNCLSKNVERFGESTVNDFFVKALTIASRNPALALKEDGKSDEEIQIFMSSWMPGQRLPRSAVVVDPVKHLLDNLDSIPPERIEALLQHVRRLQGIVEPSEPSDLEEKRPRRQR